MKFIKNLMKENPLLIVEILVIALILLGTLSCRTTKVEIKREVPTLDFPQFPEVDGDFLEDTNEVKINLDTYINLAKFKIDYEGLKEYYEAIKERTQNDSF